MECRRGIPPGEHSSQLINVSDPEFSPWLILLACGGRGSIRIERGMLNWNSCIRGCRCKYECTQGHPPPMLGKANTRGVRLGGDLENFPCCVSAVGSVKGIYRTKVTCTNASRNKNPGGIPESLLRYCWKFFCCLFCLFVSHPWLLISCLSLPWPQQD